MGVGRDITGLKQTQFRLERSLDEKAVLLREVHHRVKNNLQIIVSLLRLRSQDLEDGETRRAFRDTMARVASMAEVHERLYLATAIPLGLIVTELISNAAKHALLSRPAGLVTGTFDTSETSFALTVTDNGPGLPPERAFGWRRLNGPRTSS